MVKLRNQSTQKVVTSNSKKVDCNVSIASIEIMLYRIFDGNRLEFPFLNHSN